jgi:hypothetical protein
MMGIFQAQPPYLFNHLLHLSFPSQLFSFLYPYSHSITCPSFLLNSHQKNSSIFIDSTVMMQLLNYLLQFHAGKIRAPTPSPSLRSIRYEHKSLLIIVYDLHSTFDLWVSDYHGGEVPCPWLWHLTHLVSSGREQGNAKNSGPGWGHLMCGLGFESEQGRECLACYIKH